jgi:hypothetical protein
VSSTASETASGASVRAISPARNGRIWLLVPALLFIVSAALTHPPFIGDSLDHAAIVAKVVGHTAPASDLSEAGHILWRPLGYISAPVVSRAVPDSVAWTPTLKICFGLTLVSVLSGFIATILIFDIARRITGSGMAALVTAVLFVWGDAVLAYSRSGMSYIPGLAVLLIGLWWQITARRESWAATAGPAVLFGVAVLLWLPYAIAVPAACCARRLLGRGGLDWRGKWTREAAAVLTAGAVIAVGVGTAAIWARVHSGADAIAWLTAAGHGMRQNRQAIRAVTGCSRLLLDLGHDGVYLKRFLFHDPYSPVSAVGLFGYSLWKVAFFYFFLGCCAWLGWKSPAGRRALLLAALAGAPALLAAVVVFEPSSPERFLPFLPFLLLAIAAGWNAARNSRSAWWARAGVVLFAAALPVVNLPGFTGGENGWRKQAAAQVTQLRAEAAPSDAVFTVTMAEPLEELRTHPFDPLNRAGAIEANWIIEPINVDAAHWPGRFAKLAESNWAFGRSVWVERAAMEDRPRPNLLWVEGDNPKVHWRDVPVFFRGLQLDADTGGPDGFVRVAHSPANEAKLREAEAAGAESQSHANR